MTTHDFSPHETSRRVAINAKRATAERRDAA
jgi:hypothetical protein